MGLLGALLIWGIYLAFTALAAWVAWNGIWPMTVPDLPASVAGAMALIGGVVLVAGGLTALGSIGSVSGCDHSSLAQTGIYRYTRNPQNVGWGIALVGVALLGQSWMALLLAIGFLVLFRLYVPFEERHLEKVYGAEWRRYEQSSPRFLDLSKIRAGGRTRSTKNQQRLLPRTR